MVLWWGSRRSLSLLSVYLFKLKSASVLGSHIGRRGVYFDRWADPRQHLNQDMPDARTGFNVEPSTALSFTASSPIHSCRNSP
ncbi:hypothetical protein C8R46DRAFT_182902 [Mycena filopes]|nr:hypothetical protein C8R46DRAFT_182902 [Mycena filopes]